MESNQVHVFAAAVSCDSQQIINTVKSRFTGQIERDVGDGYLRDRVHHDVALFHPVPATNLHVGPRPDANAASDSSIPNSLAEVLTEHHMENHPSGHRPSQALAPPVLWRASAAAARLFRDYTGLARLQSRPALWIRVAAASGFMMTLLNVVLSVFPIIEVESRLRFAIRISGVIVVANVIGAALFIAEEKKRSARGPFDWRQSSE
jgi:hypothetical protein